MIVLTIDLYGLSDERLLRASAIGLLVFSVQQHHDDLDDLLKGRHELGRKRVPELVSG